ncbi:AAEL005628-PA [Aedes aegypti]|uniref:RNA-binding protein NOB1 n=1 Tax=Aedes aegypti TaxID=7159 RepID=Q0IFE9_AEDAE|nr:AAEL005628-PA [Aedes aegypti]
MSKFTHLVVDTSAFIKNAPLQDLAENCYTVQGVVDEIKNDRQLKRLVVLPYSLQVREPDSEVLAKVTNFAKKTGDFASLSLVDLKVLALTYQLEKEHVGTEHLREEPKPAKTVSSGQKPQELVGTGKVLGFYEGKKAETEAGPSGSVEKREDEPAMEIEESSEELVEQLVELCSDEAEELEEQILKKIEPQEAEDEEDMSEDEEEAGQAEDEDDDDDEGWITPSNIKEIKRDYGTDLLEESASPVACMTTDFAMQNVLKQIGLHIAALDGRVIKHARTYILRCYACFKTTPDSTKRFCPNCGNNTLKKVAVSLDDQPLPQQRISAKAKAKTNALGDDYTAGYSPFVMRDVDSRSAVLRGKSNLKQWMKNYEYDNHRRGYKK